MNRNFSVITGAIAALALSGVAPWTASASSVPPVAVTHQAHRTAHTVSFYARVVRAGRKGLLLRRSGGKRVWLPTTEVARIRVAPARPAKRRGPRLESMQLPHHRGSSPPNLARIRPGTRIHVTESVESGHDVSATLTIPAPGTAPPTDPLANAGTSGTITAVSSSALTIDSANGQLRFEVDSPDTTQGFLVGDDVEVLYDQNGDGTLTATDLEYAEEAAVGPVTATTTSSITITNSQSGRPQTFVDDPGLTVEKYCSASFSGVAIGSWALITYHVSGGQLVVETFDPTWPPE